MAVEPEQRLALLGRGRGIAFYVWISDQHTHYAARVVRTTVRDTTYVLDGILDNQTELPIEKQSTPPTPRATPTSCSRSFDLLGLAVRAPPRRAAGIPPTPSKKRIELLSGTLELTGCPAHADAGTP